MNKSSYKIRMRGRLYVVYRMEYTETGGTGTPVYTTNEFEDARKKLYELNGWKYNPQKKKTS